MEIIKLDQNSSCFVIEPIRTDSAICANCKELLRCFERFSLYSVKFLILPLTVVLNNAS